MESDTDVTIVTSTRVGEYLRNSIERLESDRNLFLPKYYAEYLTEYSAWGRYYSAAYYSAIYRIFGIQCA